MDCYGCACFLLSLWYIHSMTSTRPKSTPIRRPAGKLAVMISADHHRKLREICRVERRLLGDQVEVMIDQVHQQKCTPENGDSAG